jgi:hypothetical protein
MSKQRRTADDFVRDMKAKQQGFAKVVSSASKADIAGTSLIAERHFSD